LPEPQLLPLLLPPLPLLLPPLPLLLLALPELVQYRFVIDDPDTYEVPVEGRLDLLWREGEELFEYVCQQSNYAHELMVNPDDLLAIGRTSDIVP